MQTPFQILLSKKRQDKKRICFSQQKRNLQIQYQSSLNKSCLTQKSNPTYIFSKQKSISHSPDPFKICDKKYQIIFRQSIRKFNTFRYKVNHTHTVLKNQNFKKKIITNKQGSKSESILFKMQEKPQLQKIQRLFNYQHKNCNPEIQALSPSRFQNKINLLSNKTNQNKWLSQKIPQFSVQKCRINFNANQNKINERDPEINLQVLKKLYKIRCSTRINTCEQVSRVKQSYQNDYLSTTGEEQVQHNSIKERRCNAKPKKIVTDQIVMINNKLGELDEEKVANFIKGKKTKRTIFLESPRKIKNSEQFFFRRTITDNLYKKNMLYQKIQSGYFSPNKKNRSKFNIKLNSFDNSISGWEIQPNQVQKIYEEEVMDNFQVKN